MPRPTLETLALGNASVPYLRVGQGHPLLFLQGFGVALQHYKPLFDALGARFEIFAPDLLRANRFRGQPGGVEDFSYLVAEFCARLQLNELGVVGHSLGGAVSFSLAAAAPHLVRWLVGLNPALPIAFGPSGLLRRSLRKGARETIGREGLKAVWFANLFHPSFVYHGLRDLRTTTRIIQDISRLDYADLHIPQPALMVYGEDDELFHLSPFVQRQLHKTFDHLTIERLPGLNHDWPVFQPVRAALAIGSFHDACE